MKIILQILLYLWVNRAIVLSVTQTVVAEWKEVAQLFPTADGNVHFHDILTNVQAKQSPTKVPTPMPITSVPVTVAVSLPTPTDDIINSPDFKRIEQGE